MTEVPSLPLRSLVSSPRGDSIRRCCYRHGHGNTIAPLAMATPKGKHCMKTNVKVTKQIFADTSNKRKAKSNFTHRSNASSYSLTAFFTVSSSWFCLASWTYQQYHMVVETVIYGCHWESFFRLPWLFPQADFSLIKLDHWIMQFKGFH